MHFLLNPDQIAAIRGACRDEAAFAQVMQALEAGHVLDDVQSAVIVLDGRGRIVHYNSICEKMTASPLGEMRGRPVWELGALTAEDRARARAYVRQVYEGRADTPFEHNWVRPDGTRHRMRWWLRRRTGPDDRPLTVATGVDVTEEHQNLLHYRAVVEDQTELIYRADAQGVLTFVNAAYCRYVNKKPEEMLGQRYVPHIVDEDWHYARELLQTFTPDSPALMYDVRIIPDETTGEVRWLRIIHRAFYDEAEHLTGYQAVGRDVTEQRRAEEALRHKSAQLETVFNSIPDPIIMTDTERRIIMVNPAFTRHFGYTPEEVEGQSTRLLYADPDEHYQNRPEAYPADSDPHIYRILVRRKDGSEFLCETVRTTLQMEPLGALGYLSILRDVTDRQQAEAALRASEERFRQIAETVREVFYIYDPLEQKIIYVSPAYDQLFQLSGQGLLENPLDFLKAAHPDDVPAIKATLRREAETGESVEHTYRIIRPDGEIRWVHTRHFPLYEGARQLVRIIGLAEDITGRKRAEEALRESEERFRQIASLTSDGLYDWDIVAGSIWRSDELRSILGMAPDDNRLPGGWISRLHPDDAERAPASLQAALDGDVHEWHDVYRYLRPDGRYVTLSDTGYILRDENGRPVRMLGAVIDITERRQAEEALRKSEERFRMIARVSNDGLYDWDIVNSSTWRSDELRSMIGLDPDEVPLHVNWAARLHPDDADRVTASRQAALDGDGHEWRAVYRFRRTDGRYITMSDTGYILRDEKGRAVRMLGAVTDITERQQAEAALRESEERFRQIAENISGVFYMMDAEARNMLYISPGFEEMWPLTRDEIYGDIHRLWEPIHEDDRPLVLAAARREVYDRVPTEVEYRVHARDGSARWILVRSFPVLDAEGRHYRIAGFAEDITERKQAAAQQFELSVERERIRILSTFIRDVMHEFRTPLSIINTSIYLLERQREPERIRQHSDKARQQVENIIKLLDALLTMMRLDSGEPMQQKPVNINQLVKDICVLVQPEAAQQQHNIDTSLADDLPPVSGDLSALRLAVLNLLQNAVRYTRPGGEISLSTGYQQENRAVVVTVRDNGVGIKSEDLPRIFERFFRLDEAHTTRGFGLGLTIALKIAEAHGGKITVESAPGEGSIFCLLLPLGKN